MASPTTITVQQLQKLIGTPSAPVLVDVCLDEDFRSDPRLIPGAFRHPFEDVLSLAGRLAGRRAIIICQKGRKLSEGAAAILRTRGVQAEYLEGGNFGWRDAGLPLIPVERIPARNRERKTIWVTRHRPKVDRIACPWLIRRFVDPAADFLFVSPGEVIPVAERYGATPFDVGDVFWTHRGDQCTFDTMVEEFNLTTPPLERMGDIIRAADTNTHHTAPQAPGLHALSVGLSRLFRNDLEQLEAGLVIYDALYRWARDGQDEIHECPAPEKGVAN